MLLLEKQFKNGGCSFRYRNRHPVVLVENASGPEDRTGMLFGLAQPHVIRFDIGETRENPEAQRHGNAVSGSVILA